MPGTFKILCNGRVQGVGFRPYVSRLARKYGLKGTVSNNEDGVIIIASGTTSRVMDFYKRLISEPPPVARIKGHSLTEIAFRAYHGFEIIPTTTKGKLNLALTPDFGICSSCSAEIVDPENRRYHYPFTTCVDCGPRWSVTNTFPFERVHTNLSGFTMCPECQTEYVDQLNRRFHSQTNSCPTCGIRLELTDQKGNLIEVADRDIYKQLSIHIRKGRIIAIKNTNGYLLCCDALNPEVIERLRNLKRRPKKPFAVLYPCLDLLKHDLAPDTEQIEELCSSERPIVIMSSRGFKGKLSLEAIAPDLYQLGVMLPNSGLLDLLMKELQQPVIATSGNIHGSPIIADKDQALELISEVADFFLHHNLDISNAQDDSVVKFSFKHRQRVMFRRSRGFAPNYFAYSSGNKKKVMALGGHLKSTIAFAPNDYLYLSQYIGNLDHFEVYKRFVATIGVFRRIFQEAPDAILVDKHPAYLSTQYGMELAASLGIPVYEIQHHKAHFASVLGEHNLFDTREKVLGVVWDGTGFGEDEHIWGGEFFAYKAREIQRVGHFSYFDWLAGDKMSKEPRLSLFSLNQDPEAAFLNKKYTALERKIFKSLKSRGTLKTSSVGRLFDAVASLLDLCDLNSYEGEAAMLLENAVSDYDCSQLKAFTKVSKTGEVSTQALWKHLYRDYCQGVSKERLILNFLFTLNSVILDMAVFMGVQKIALSGGVFQNTLLIDMLHEMNENRFDLFFNRNLAPNDENISFGQFMYEEHCLGNT